MAHVLMSNEYELHSSSELTAPPDGIVHPIMPIIGTYHVSWKKVEKSDDNDEDKI